MDPTTLDRLNVRNLSIHKVWYLQRILETMPHGYEGTTAFTYLDTVTLLYQFLTIIPKKGIWSLYHDLRGPAWSVPICLIWYSATLPFTHYMLAIRTFNFSNIPSFFLFQESSSPPYPNMTFLLKLWNSASTLFKRKSVLINLLFLHSYSLTITHCLLPGSFLLVLTTVCYFIWLVICFCLFPPLGCIPKS